MKLNCSVTIVNRFATNLGVKGDQRYKNAVLTIMKPPKENIIYLLLVTSKFKQGTRYKIRENIEKTFGQFMHKGKATIRFREPPHDLLINADELQLKNFMSLLKKVWNKELDKIPEMLSTTIPQVKQAHENKLDIKDKSKYPVLKGFPIGLEILKVNNCHLKRVDNRILQLKHLTTLCMDKNNLTQIPLELKELSLLHLSLSYNKLGNNFHSWQFLSWPLSNILEYLNLSGNKIKYFPSSLSRFNKLKVLKLSNICINKIPFQVLALKNLQELDLSRNCLSALPGMVTKRQRKFDKLDISENKLIDCSMETQNFYTGKQIPAQYIPSLLEFTIRSILENRIPYNEYTIPSQLISLLDEAKLCKCGKIFSKDFGSIFSKAETQSLANTFISSHHCYTVSVEYKACCPQHFN